MSSFSIIGFFGLASGRHISLPRPSDSSLSTNYVVYTTSIQLNPTTAVPAEIRMWSPRNSIVHSDDSVAFIIAKAFVPAPHAASATVLLDPYFIHVFPGNPQDDSYKDSIPDLPFPYVYALGTVTGTHTVLPNQHISFPLQLTEYVRDENKTSVIQSVSLFITITLD
jgi:hypothetical protein